MEKADPRDCTECGITFSPNKKYDYVKKCFPCWQQSGGTPGGPSTKMVELLARKAVLEQTVDRLTRENVTLQNAINFMNKKQGGIAPDKVKRLLMLCHPDKHENSVNANKITTWLLGFRR